MGFFNRLGRLVRANANAAVSSMEDPVKILDQSVADMQADLVKLRQAVALAIASQKRLRSQADQAQTQAKTWYERAELALKKGEEDLAREALSRRKTFQETATSLQGQVQSQDGQVESLKKSLVALEGKIAEAKTKKDMLKARAQAAQAQQQLQSAVGSIGTDSAMAAFERMEKRSRQWKPLARPRPNLPVPISKVSLLLLRAEMMSTMSWQPCAISLRQVRKRWRFPLERERLPMFSRSKWKRSMRIWRN